jgi:hypothetical protein
MSARTDALLSRAETGKMSSASIVPVMSGCHPAVRSSNAAPPSWFDDCQGECFFRALKSGTPSRRNFGLARAFQFLVKRFILRV